MVNTFTISFKDGLFLDPKSPYELSKENWILKTTKEKIICLLSKDEINIKYQVFSNGYFKLSRKKDKKWITLKKGWLNKTMNNTFSGYITLPKNYETRLINCKMA